MTATGRISRGDYLKKCLVPWWTALAAGIGVHLLSTSTINSMGGLLVRDIIWGGFLVVMAIIYVMAASKRWHDLGRSAKWNYGLLFPPMFVIYSVILGMKPGQAGDNRYGPSTQAGSKP